VTDRKKFKLASALTALIFTASGFQGLSSAGHAADELADLFEVLHVPHGNVVDLSAPNLVGRWSGKVEGGAGLGSVGHEPALHKPTFADRSLRFTLEIEQQDGRGLIGNWSSEMHKEGILGVIRMDNQNVLFVDEDSYFTGKLLCAGPPTRWPRTCRQPPSMELCLLETHPPSSMGAWCLLMHKE